MKRNYFSLNQLWVMIAALFVIGLGSTQSFSIADAQSAQAPNLPKWQRSLPTVTCPAGDQNCFRGSPVIVDVDNDGRDDIVVVTHSGRVIALKDNGTSNGGIIFNVDIGPMIGVGANNARISSSPAVADIDNNDGGRVEIVVGFGHEVCCTTHGGVIVLEHTGALKSGWPRMSIGTASNGIPHTVFGTPAVGDLDNDGDLEIVVGGFDKRIYAYQHNGNPLPGFTPPSHHAVRFPTWPNIQDRLADTIWSSPALGDVDGDGYLDIVIGADEGNYDSRYGGDSGGWTCPYALPAGWPGGYCGGALYVINRHGNNLPGFPIYTHEITQSTPAVGDIDNDGKAEIFVGTGSFYHYNSPDNPTNGFRLYGYNNNGSPLPGWAGGKPLGNVAPASPSIGNIAGDGKPEIIIGALDGKIYAFNLNGSAVSGFPSTARGRLGHIVGFDVAKGFVLADYDSDGLMEIFATVRESVVVMNGNGQQITSINNGNDGKPAYATGGWLINTPAVGDIDNDGMLELIAHDSFLYVWNLSADADSAEWPMWKQNAARNSRVVSPGFLESASEEVNILCQSGQSCNTESGVGVWNGGELPLEWALNTGGVDGRVNFHTSSGTIPAFDSALIRFDVNISGLSNGWHFMGTVDVNTTSNGGPAGSASIPIWVFRGNVDMMKMPVIFNE